MKQKWRIGAGWVLLLAVIIQAGCGHPSQSVLDPAGPAGRSQLGLIYLSTGIMTLVVIVVAAIYIYVVYRFRERPGEEEIPEQVEGSRKLEVLWTVIPIILLVILAVPTISATFTLNKKPEPEQSMRVNVVGFQYWWGFEYPDLGVQTANEVHIPTGTQVDFQMTSGDVIHAFWAPSLGGKQDLNPGIQNRLVLEADRPGVYEGRCTELCGASHALMNFRVIAHPPEEFEEWVASMRNPSSQPQTPLASEGKKLVSQNCIGCHAIDGAGFEIKGRTGPNLTAFGKRTRIAGVWENNKENLEAWLKDPQVVKPGNRMPAFDHLSKKEISALVEYLSDLK
ncbi:cytochrome c oxidase subunit II [Paludifilum halophilum]|uniref:Cytochrome c oxidase subunit 2 n=2 Tax=Paludifilum halophilum TaxID=1642702 RepID=A0A235B497_9BACL|nr:cytochrome c oxidase subunit II [Paludifilum halophilum]